MRCSSVITFLVAGLGLSAIASSAAAPPSTPNLERKSALPPTINEAIVASIDSNGMGAAERPTWMAPSHIIKKSALPPVVNEAIVAAIDSPRIGGADRATWMAPSHIIKRDTSAFGDPLRENWFAPFKLHITKRDNIGNSGSQRGYRDRRDNPIGHSGYKEKRNGSRTKSRSLYNDKDNVQEDQTGYLAKRSRIGASSGTVASNWCYSTKEKRQDYGAVNCGYKTKEKRHDCDSSTWGGYTTKVKRQDDGAPYSYGEKRDDIGSTFSQHGYESKRDNVQGTGAGYRERRDYVSIRFGYKRKRDNGSKNVGYGSKRDGGARTGGYREKHEGGPTSPEAKRDGVSSWTGYRLKRTGIEVGT